jgi:reactive intermediate/imine deaminase
MPQLHSSAARHRVRLFASASACGTLAALTACATVPEPATAPASTPAAAVAAATATTTGTAVATTPPQFLDRRTWGERGPPFSEAVRHGDTLYLSGQIGTQPGTMQLAPGGMVPEARQTLANIRDVLRAYGLDLGDVVKCTVMLADMKDWPAFNEVYREFFVPPFPARSALGANGLALGACVEVECIAAIRR